MASGLARRVLNPRFLSHLPTNSTPRVASLPSPRPFICHPPITVFYRLSSHSHPFAVTSRYLSSTPPPAPPEPSAGAESSAKAGPEGFKHQEIEGPTVERDLSPLANETREVFDKMRKSIHGLSTVFALLAIAHLGVGAWLVYTMPEGSPQEVPVQGIAAFAFPFATAFLMRRSLKAMAFFDKMEGMGRLQILTSVMQQVKWMELWLRRTRVVGVCCILGVSAGTLVAISKR